jgi:hypothetical protein
MKNIFGFLWVTGLMVTATMAQPKETALQNKGQRNNVSLNFDLPLGDFSKSYGFGIGADYSWSKHRYGKMPLIPAVPFGFTFNIGGDYYIGKKVTIGTPPYTGSYDYGGYTYLHAYAGDIYNPCAKGNISLTAGPALGLSGGHSDFNIGIDLSGSIYLGNSGKFGITPNLTLMKQAGSDPLYTGGIRLNFSF